MKVSFWNEWVLVIRFWMIVVMLIIVLRVWLCGFCWSWNDEFLKEQKKSWRWWRLMKMRDEDEEK